VLDSIFGFLNNLITPVTDLIDKSSFGEEERFELKKAMFELQAQTTEKLAELQLEAQKLQVEIIKSENKDGNWLQKSYRPILILSLVGVLIASLFGIVVIPDWIEEVVKLSFGMFIGGRSLEKITPKALEMFK